MSRRPVALALALVALAAPPAARAGDVRGVVRYAGPVPPPAPRAVTKDRATCGDAQPDDSLLVDGGRLANAVVAIRGAGAPPSPARATLEQRRCRFAPRVQVAPVGATLEVVNGDPILHGVHGWTGKATAFNLPQAEEGQRDARPLPKAGLVRVGCDVHSWMEAWIWVADGPAAVSGRDGAFHLAGVPAGTWTVTAWHERLGERTQQVTVPASGDAVVELTFDAPARRGDG